MKVNFLDILSTFMVLFAVIDIFGSIPIILNIKNKGGRVKAGQATFVSFLVFIAFLVLRLTHWFERILGEGGIMILKKFFGIILLAIAIKLFTSNTGINI